MRRDGLLNTIMRARLLTLFALIAPSSSLRPATLQQLSRRAVIGSLASAAVAPALPAAALFESEEQVALSSLATASSKLTGLVREVAEVKRKRLRMAPDYEDDAYFFRFARSVLDPAAASIATASKKIPQAAELPGKFQSSVAAFEDACRAKSADDELASLEAAQAALLELLELAKTQKYNVAPTDDINAYDGATGILYNKFLFRSG